MSRERVQGGVITLWVCGRVYSGAKALYIASRDAHWDRVIGYVGWHGECVCTVCVPAGVLLGRRVGT